MCASVAWLLAVVATQPDTTLILARAERDLTGDGQPEILEVSGTGISIDSLNVKFVIESAGRVVYEAQLAPMTRTEGIGRGRRRSSDAEYRRRLDEFASWFLDGQKFMSPRAFIEFLERSAPGRLPDIPQIIDYSRLEYVLTDSLLAAGATRTEVNGRVSALVGRRDASYDTAQAVGIWQDIQRSPVTIFTFSPGYDAITAIAWSSADRRFYRLLECC